MRSATQMKVLQRQSRAGKVSGYEENHTSYSGETRAEIRSLMMKSIANTPIIFEEKEYQVGRQEYNHGADQIQRDFMRFDPTELEAPMRELLHATDQWAYIQEKDGMEWVTPYVKTEIENEIDRMMDGEGEKGTRAAFLRERAMCREGPLRDRSEIASDELLEVGPSYMDQVDLLKAIVRRGGNPPSGVWAEERRRSDITGNENPVGRLRGAGGDHRKAVF